MTNTTHGCEPDEFEEFEETPDENPDDGVERAWDEQDDWRDYDDWDIEPDWD